MHRRVRATLVAMGSLVLATQLAGTISSGVIAQSDGWQPPQGFSGELLCAEMVQEPTENNVGGPEAVDTEYRDSLATADVTTGDPRMTGQLVMFGSSDMYRIGDNQVYLDTVTLRLENEAGAWTATSYGFFDTAAYSETAPDPSTDIMVFSGEGDYEGLSAMAQIIGDTSACERTIRGVIFVGEPPPAPEVRPLD